jgi:hypothetical protein
MMLRLTHLPTPDKQIKLHVGIQPASSIGSLEKKRVNTGERTQPALHV